MINKITHSPRKTKEEQTSNPRKIRRAAFFSGMRSTFVLMPTASDLRQLHQLRQKFATRSDTAALNSDWENITRDMHKALETFQASYD